jgi:hypothetical protein
MRIHETDDWQEQEHRGAYLPTTAVLSGKARDLFGLMDALFGLEEVPETAEAIASPAQSEGMLLDLEG